MKKIEIEVFSDETNASVIRMPDRHYPGLVVQSDKLIYLNGKGIELAEATQKTGNSELARLAGNLRYELSELLERYNAAFRTE